jgi:acetyl-CoA acetyltransferase
MALKDTAIVAYAETEIVASSDRHVWDFGGEILDGLLEKTGIDKTAIDGMILSSSQTGASNPFWSLCTGDYLGLELDFSETLDTGGCAPIGAVARAAAAIDAGLCSTVLLLFADCQASDHNARTKAFRPEWLEPYGLMGPPGAFGLLSSRYEHQYGLDLRALAKLAVTQRTHGVMNENACRKLRVPITEDDYMNSRVISDPIRLLDSVMVCDGACGLLLTSRKHARDVGLTKLAVPIGYGERLNHQVTDSLADVTQSGHAIAGRRAFKQAGLAPKDISMLHLYDDFIIALLMQMEMLGFCETGRGAQFVMDNDFLFTGNLPLNTGGGQISAGQIGLAGGGTNLIEAVRQLFGEGGSRQVANPKNALVTGIGFVSYARNWAASAALVLVPEA